MKKLIIALVFISGSKDVYAKCNTQMVGFIRSSGFSLSFGEGKDNASHYDKNTVNVPLSINGNQACYKQTNVTSLKSEKKGEKAMENAITITPLKVEFEGVPEPHKKQYIYIERKEPNKQTKFHILSFICSGEIPLSIDAVSNTIAEIENPKSSAEMNDTFEFATGKAARNLQGSFAQQMISLESYELFSKKYKELTVKEIDSSKPCCDTFSTPSILTLSSIQSLSSIERSIVSNFTTMPSDVPNGCTADFAATMKNYLLENYSENETLKGFKIKKKWFSEDLIFEW